MKSINSEDVNKQLAEHGMTAADVVQKIMGEPELAAAFAKPQVQQAIMELQQDPMAMLKYQNDPDVMLVGSPSPCRLCQYMRHYLRQRLKFAGL